MNCEQFKANLSAYLDNELLPRDASDLHDHSTACTACQAELETFQQISALVAASPPAQPSSGHWNRIARRLDGDTMPVQSIPVGTRRPLLAVTLALAASLLLLAVVRNPVRIAQTTADRSGAGQSSANQSIASEVSGNGSATVAVDFADVMNLYAQKPSLALASLSKQFDGRDVKSDKVKELLGYEPSVVRALPTGTRLVSTQALRMPNCNCAGGVCTCGPGGCNCAASLCQRQDGTEFLVIEHCKTQSVSFGSMPTEVATHNSEEIRLVDGGNILAASWFSGGRRLTAIGIKDRAEAVSLVDAVEKVELLN